MTHWLRDQKASDKFALDEDCELFNPMDGSNVIRCKDRIWPATKLLPTWRPASR